MENLPCPKELKGECRVFKAEGECYQDVHHENWPASDYNTSVEKEYRELEINKIFVCRAIHNAIHAANKRSDKPNRATMLEALHDPKNNITNNNGDGRPLHR